MCKQIEPSMVSLFNKFLYRFQKAACSAQKLRSFGPCKNNFSAKGFNGTSLIVFLKADIDLLNDLFV